MSPGPGGGGGAAHRDEVVEVTGLGGVGATRVEGSGRRAEADDVDDGPQQLVGVSGLGGGDRGVDVAEPVGPALGLFAGELLAEVVEGGGVEGRRTMSDCPTRERPRLGRRMTARASPRLIRFGSAATRIHEKSDRSVVRRREPPVELIVGRDAGVDERGFHGDEGRVDSGEHGDAVGGGPFVDPAANPVRGLDGEGVAVEALDREVGGILVRAVGSEDRLGDATLVVAEEVQGSFDHGGRAAVVGDEGVGGGPWNRSAKSMRNPGSAPA